MWRGASHALNMAVRSGIGCNVRGLGGERAKMG